MSDPRPPWAADHELGPEQVRAILERDVPELAAARIEPLGEGWDYRGFAAGGEILRFAKRDRVTAASEAEAALLRALAPRLPLQVPRLQVHAPVEGAPHGYTRHVALPGRPLKEMKLPPSQARWLAVRLGQFIAALHAVPVEIGREAGLSTAAWDEMASAARRSAARLRALSAHVPSDLARRAERVLASPPPPGAGERALVHADLWPEHLLVDEVSLELTGVIDWGDAEIGDPAVDHAGAWFLGGDEALAACLRAAGVAWDEALVARARFHGVHHAIGDAWWAMERGATGYLDWALRALQRLP